MKKLFHAALVLPLVLCVVSCSESNDDGGDKPVKLSPETKQEQQVYADDKTPTAPIKFTAAAAWTATVAEVQTKAAGGSEVDWLTLSAYSGGAGEVSLTMTLKENATGTDRKAEIRIECAGTTLKITVEQKATKQDGTKPDPEPENPDQPTPAGYALVERIEARFWVGCEEESYRYSSSFHYEFRYDDQNRIAEYELSDYNYNDGGTELDYICTTRFDYSIQGEIRLTEHTEYDENSSDEPRTVTYRILLDDQGRATQIAADKSSYNQDPITYRYSYNDEGRLARMSWYEYSGSSTEIYEALTYQNGVLSKVEYNYDSIDQKEEIVFPADAFGDLPNDRLNIDPNWLVFTDPTEPQELLPMLRLTGKGCDRLTNWLPIDYDDDLARPVYPGYPNPGTIHEAYDYYEHEKTDPLQYTFNDDGTIASIVQPIVCVKMRHEYDIVVGNEPVNPEYPEAGYKYTVENEKRTEVNRNKDKHQWTFTYRK
ncbi:MAG: hypothetical protein NC250_04445 [Alistipes senegalensis]|nr:hypothetical protein [Bacteroides cellulosilyticus]MCM1351962.1 hypothetical protein [Alistipes senegalensis]